VDTRPDFVLYGTVLARISQCTVERCWFIQFDNTEKQLIRMPQKNCFDLINFRHLAERRQDGQRAHHLRGAMVTQEGLALSANSD
jgi:hypothetical protein